MWTLKVEFRGEVRRQRGLTCPDDEISVAVLKAAVGSLFGLSTETSNSLLLLYQDKDGNQSEITEITLPALLTENRELQVLRLKAEISTARLNDLQSSDMDVDSQGAEIGHSSQTAAVMEPSSTPMISENRQHLLAQSFSNFKQEVKTDFETSFKDMQQAVDPHGRGGAGGYVAGAAAGLVVASRLIPLRVTRIAAQAVTGKTPPEDTQPRAQATPSAEPVNQDMIRHFRHQVAADFATARSEVDTAFNCVFGSPTSSTPVSAPSSSTSIRVPACKEVVPAVAGTVAGLVVASSLLPVRVARLAIASTVANVTSAPQSDVTAYPGQSEADEIFAADEDLARQLQEEEDRMYELERTQMQA